VAPDAPPLCGADLGPGDFVNVDCAACHHVALLTPNALLRAGLNPRGEGSRPQRPAQVPRVRKEGAGGHFDRLAGAGLVTLSGVEVPKVPRPDTRPRGKERRRVGGHSRRRSRSGLVRWHQTDQAGFDRRHRRLTNIQRGTRTTSWYSPISTPNSTACRSPFHGRPPGR
jgi:hypothetical protein